MTKLKHFNMCCAQIRKKILVKQALHIAAYKYIYKQLKNKILAIKLNIVKIHIIVMHFCF